MNQNVRIRPALAAGAAVAVALLTGCPPRDFLAATSSDVFVKPLPGLTQKQLEQFNRGRALFDKTFTPAEGLGPLFNNTSCKMCHGFPDSGGGSKELLILIAGVQGDAPVTLKEQGGPVISDRALHGIPQEQFPVGTTAISKRISPITYGTGLIEAIATADILANLGQSARRQELGIVGKANYDGPELGRLGWKNQTGNMRNFTVTAANFEMGLTSKERPYEFFPNVLPQAIAAPPLYASASYPFVKAFFDSRGAASASLDLTPAQVDDMTFFQRFQAPPPPLPLTVQAAMGKEAFTRIGCAECHVPSFKTAKNAIGIPEGVTANLYSDLLLHDMGPLMDDGIKWQGAAKGTEWRTTPLWGLRFRKVFLHDGRTDSLDDAIRNHGGEGAKVTAAYNALDAASRDAIKAFLMSI
ncbi:MAG: hypothetical protein FJZ01_01290 [Candidatus Sericytochromatia bacterium]|nr:hypothetical protein [Candidatus Tanganyikabacteria bacterium]